jgi:predicted anti-sigma-YlaC factor YlaD
VKLTCDELDALLPEFFDGALDSTMEAAAAEHLATCDACRVVVDDLGRVGELARDHGRFELPPDVRVRIREVLESAGDGT